MAQNNGHVSIPRSLHNHPDVLSAPPIQYKILMHIIYNSAYTEWEQDDHGIKIILQPFQYMGTVRQIAKDLECDKNDVERALKRFSKCGILRLEVRHVKTIVTVEYLRVYFQNLDKKEDEVRQDLRQERDKKETQKNNTIKEQDNNPSSIIKKNREWSDKFEENWAKLADDENDSPMKLHGTAIDNIVRKYQIPEKEINKWRASFSCDYIVATIVYLETHNVGGLFTKLNDLLTNNDQILYVMLCSSDLVPLINEALQKDYVKKSKKTKEKKLPPSEIGLVLAKELYETIITYHPGFDKPDLYEWAEDFDKMTKKGREPEEIRNVIRFLKTSDFWQPHVLTVKYLSRKFNTLAIQSRSPKNQSRAYSGGQRLSEYDKL